MFTSDKSVQTLYTVFKHILHVTSSRASTLVSRDFDSSRAEPVTQIFGKMNDCLHRSATCRAGAGYPLLDL